MIHPRRHDLKKNRDGALGTVLGSVRAAPHCHGLPALEASELGCTSQDFSAVLVADTNAVLATSTVGGRGIAAEIAAGVDLAPWSGVRLLDSRLRPVRDRDVLGDHIAD